MEMDYEARAKEEVSWFRTEQGNYVVCKSPEYLSEEGLRYISDLYRQFERAIYNGGTDPETGKDYREVVDLDSLARCYLVMELSADVDAFRSSTFFYKPQGEDKLYCGPVWDFDLAYGSNLEELIRPDGYKAAKSPTGSRLLRITSFLDKIRELYRQELQPLVDEVLLSQDTDAERGALRSIAGLEEEISLSKAMDDVLWPDRLNRLHALSPEPFSEYLSIRSAWLLNESETWREDETVLTYLDVHSWDWFYPSVIQVTEQGLFSGYDAMTFAPDDTMTRAMAVTVLYRVAGEPEVEYKPFPDTETAASDAPEASADTPFPDVPSKAWYAKAVIWAEENGIVLGYDDGLFHPNDLVTRQQLVTMLYRYAQTAPRGETDKWSELSIFLDCGTVGAYAVVPMGWAVRSGIVQGDDGQLLPLANASRAEAAAIFQRYYDLICGIAYPET